MNMFKIVPVLLLGACVDSNDPADGGFVNGIAGLSSGSYDERIEERELVLDQSRQKNAALNAELSALQGQLDGAKAQLARERGRLRSQGAALPPAKDQEINEVLARTPAGSTPEEQAASLRQAIADARNLSGQLSKISI